MVGDIIANDAPEIIIIQPVGEESSQDSGYLSLRLENDSQAIVSQEIISESQAATVFQGHVSQENASSEAASSARKKGRPKKVRAALSE